MVEASEEADGVARDEQRMDTREYRFDDTSRIELDEKKKKKKEEQDKAEADAKKSEAGKLPKFEVKKEQPKDTQEAAQQVLRKLFNRG